MPERAFFVYKMTTDNGGAPCVQDNLLTLAICKPVIRRVAKVGDWIFGFGGNGELQNRLIYIAEVTGKLCGRIYYKDYSKRRDAIYKWSGGRFTLRRTAVYHADGNNINSDVGQYPGYKNAYVLLSDDFRYFGNTQYEYDENLLSYVNQNRMRPHRTNFEAPQRSQLRRLKKKVWREYQEMKIGDPTHDTPDGRKRSCSG
ncbi:MAG: hypothetical protein Q8P24_16495 [Desulfobacterales bacterium]|nr:hypothetical protein [Desulfobacterales bacterium]